MIIRFLAPFAEELGAGECSIELQRPKTLEELLGLLADRHAGFRKYISRGDRDNNYRHSFVCIRGGRMLKLQDTVENDDTIEIIAPIMGG